MQSDLIIISEYCRKCGIEPSFISMLEEDGLIDVEEKDDEKCLQLSQLSDIEKYARMYYDLSINKLVKIKRSSGLICHFSRKKCILPCKSCLVFP